MRKSDLNGSASNLGDSSLTNMNESLTTEHTGGNDTSAINLVPNFQCHLCPCKYKRSNDLTKHLRLKHHILGPRSGGYNKSSTAANGVNGGEPDQDDDEYEDMDEIDQMNENGEYVNTSNEDMDGPVSHNHHSVKQVNGHSPPTITNNNNNSSSHVVKQALSHNNELLCPYCVYTTRAAPDYIVHVRDHLAGKMFRCVLCNSVYKYRGDCVVHLKRKHQSADMIAHNYVDKFALDTMPLHTIYTLLKPKQTDETAEGGVEQEKLFGCAYCDYKANYKGDVYKHQTRRHPGTPKLINALASQNNSLILGGGHGHSHRHHNHHQQQHNHSAGDLSRLHGNISGVTMAANSFSNNGEDYGDEEYGDEDYEDDVYNEDELDNEDSGSGSGGGGGGSAGVDRPVVVAKPQPINVTLVAPVTVKPLASNKEVISLDGEEDEDYEEYGNHHNHNNHDEYDDDVDEINDDEMMMEGEEDDLMMDDHHAR
jgi:hypothetical protein